VTTHRGGREGGRGSFVGGRGRITLSDIDGKFGGGARQGGREGTDGLQDALTDRLEEGELGTAEDEVFGSSVVAAAALASMLLLLLLLLLLFSSY
jgi:hypothetical protein